MDCANCANSHPVAVTCVQNLNNLLLFYRKKIVSPRQTDWKSPKILLAGNLVGDISSVKYIGSFLLKSTFLILCLLALNKSLALTFFTLQGAFLVYSSCAVLVLFAYLQNGLFSSLNCLLSLGFSFLLWGHTFPVCLGWPLGLMCSFTLTFFISAKRLNSFFVTTACYMKKHPCYLGLGINEILF